MIRARKIELLAPAKDVECGIEAINHGADAVYIGAPKFSARASAGNTVEDIERLVSYAHLYNARIYVALNTILKDEELKETESLIWDLYNIGVDAIIIQDMGITQLNLPPIPLHASTQTDNRNVDKIKFLEDAGFSQIVLARELTVNEIKKISESVSTPLEVFVHGSLCVSYSGQCYLSQAITKRSANRGACAQLCRLPYTLVDSDNKVIMQNKHLLSMKDLKLSDNLEELLDVGVSSLKIEGRLKDITYVKNIVAYYRQKLDTILNKRPEYIRASSGESKYSFTPNPEKSFNRGFTKYFLHGRDEDDIWSLKSPKSTGEFIGKVKDVFDHFFVLSGTKILNNGDGLCFYDEKDELRGIRVNRVEGEKIFPFEKNIKIKKGTQIYRNSDHEFERSLQKKSADRKIPAIITFREAGDGFALDIEDADENSATLFFKHDKEPALKDPAPNLIANLSKAGNTIFNIEEVKIQTSGNWFIPSSQISEWRRMLIEKLIQVRKLSYKKEITSFKKTFHSFPSKSIDYRGNVMNNLSKEFYISHNTEVKEYAFEESSYGKNTFMFTRHCIKYSLGLCPKNNTTNNRYKEPFYIIHNNNRLIVNFDCKNCEMTISGD